MWRGYCRVRRASLTILLDAAEDVVDVVWEEALRIEHRLDQTGDSAKRHVLCVRVSVPLKRAADGLADCPAHTRRVIDVGHTPPAAASLS